MNQTRKAILVFKKKNLGLFSLGRLVSIFTTSEVQKIAASGMFVEANPWQVSHEIPETCHIYISIVYDKGCASQVDLVAPLFMYYKGSVRQSVMWFLCIHFVILDDRGLRINFYIC
jgi:hypothetical protein